jgi:hypothetical protein
MLVKMNALNSAEPKFQLAVIVFILINSFVLVCWPMQVSASYNFVFATDKVSE